jgi:hypothetical protein
MQHLRQEFELSIDTVFSEIAGDDYMVGPSASRALERCSRPLHAGLGIEWRPRA